MSAAYKQLVQHLDERDVSYRADSDAEAIRVDVHGGVGTYRLVAAVDDTGELFQVWGDLPILIPAGGRVMIAEAITRANYGLRIGKFEMDFDDGELRFQIAHVLAGDVLEDSVIARLFATSLAMLDRYLPAFLSVVYGNELPEEAIQVVEQPERLDAE